MDALLEEINRKRKLLEENEITKKKKYFKRGDLLAQEKERVLKERENKDREEREKMERLTAESNKGATDVTLLLSNEEISREEVIKRLRARSAPIRLFGETDNDSCQRLKIIEMMEREDNEGLRNDFQSALEKIESAYFPGCDEPIGETEKAGMLNKGDSKLDCRLLINFLKNLMNMWADDLNHKMVNEGGNIKVRMEGGRFEQTSYYLDPLMNMLKNNTLSPDLLHSMTLITQQCLQGDYVKANDIYLQMAIGNAPWPIGVTMVGIHARTGRERIFSKHVAHVLNDETQRKYIQGLKRLMTLCQKKFPSDPSKSVEFGG